MFGRLAKQLLLCGLLAGALLLMSAGKRPFVRGAIKLSPCTWVTDLTRNAEFDAYLKWTKQIDTIDYTQGTKLKATTNPQEPVQFISWAKENYGGVGLKKGWDIRLPSYKELRQLEKREEINPENEWTLDDLSSTVIDSGRATSELKTFRVVIVKLRR